MQRSFPMLCLINNILKPKQMIKPLTAREASLENPLYPEHRIGVCVGVNMYDAVKNPTVKYHKEYVDEEGTKDKAAK